MLLWFKHTGHAAIFSFLSVLLPVFTSDFNSFTFLYLRNWSWMYPHLGTMSWLNPFLLYQQIRQWMWRCFINYDIQWKCYFCYLLPPPLSPLPPPPHHHHDYHHHQHYHHHEYHHHHHHLSLFFQPTMSIWILSLFPLNRDWFWPLDTPWPWPRIKYSQIRKKLILTTPFLSLPVLPHWVQCSDKELITSQCIYFITGHL